MEQTIYHTRLATILARIDADPSCWDQTAWHCGTAHCLAGHAQIDAGLPASNAVAADDAEDWLGMSKAVANWAFSGERTLDELRSLMEFDLSSAYAPDGFDCEGFDCDWFDREGFNCEGYNRDGIDCDGYNLAGFDSGGFDCEGYDRDGFDLEGYARDDDDLAS